MVEAGANALAEAMRARNAIFLNMMNMRQSVLVSHSRFLWRKNEKNMMESGGIYALCVDESVNFGQLQV
jgi:hypothetical protein